ncbi:alternative ribosome rescue aminoacyl-tRNA hydrolase ArfB [Flavobacterium sp.]|jgi:ribosome-associated protein|uniref:alternative ribosome rescue aminoacyl-tRNA hydrolase ArfB n=1 Tax=Flavobacterium sp. TaxID=239 RepID=UPI0037BEB029
MEKDVILTEVSFKAVRSSGAGGQNVNKVASKVVLSFYLNQSKGLTDEEKARLQHKIATKLTQDSLLIITSEEDRSQFKNRTIAINKLIKCLDDGLKIPKKRQKTKVPRSVNEKRLQAKKVMSVVKQNRKAPNL